MIGRKYGNIINIASDTGKAGSTGQVVYGAAKGGIISFTKGLAIEMARHGLRINCVSPGLVNTPMWNQEREKFPKLAEAYEHIIPWKRVGEPEEMASVVLFLASDDSSYITGQSLSVNGGMATY
jgi:2-hydroxycyclohexanecarboxyl-CoA dehydrogenase